MAYYNVAGRNIKLGNIAIINIIVNIDSFRYRNRCYQWFPYAHTQNTNDNTHKRRYESRLGPILFSSYEKMKIRESFVTISTSNNR